MNMIQTLDEIAGRLAAAAPGPEASWAELTDPGDRKTAPAWIVDAGDVEVRLPATYEAGRIAAFIAHAPEDTRRLLLAVGRIIELHRPARREQAKYNDQGTLISYTITHDGPCVECHPERMPTHCVDCVGEDCTGHGNSWHSWPCATIKAVTEALEGGT